MESLRAQEGAVWHLIARDDASIDGTPVSLLAWKKRLGDRMTLIENIDRNNLGVVENFNTLLGSTRGRWVMTADPDDIWLPEKIGRSLGVLREAETRFGEATPLAVFTDLEVIDEQEHVIARSYWRWAHNDPDRISKITHVAMETPAIGPTMVVNRALLNLALPIPRATHTQDWWLAMVAAAFGHLIAIKDQTVRYRRHASNDSSPPAYTSMGELARNILTAPGKLKRRLEKVLYEQTTPLAGAFVERYRDQLNLHDVSALEALAGLRSRGPIRRRMDVLRHGLWFASPLKNVGFILLC